MMKKLLFFLIFSIGALQSAEIRSIEFKGLNHLSPLTASEISGLRTGQNLSQYRAHQAIANLFAQGYFDDAYITQDGGHVVVYLKEKPMVAKLNIKGVVSNDRKKMEEIIGINPGQFLDDVSKRRAKERIRQYYEVKGYFDTVAEFETRELNPNSLEVDAIVNRGEYITIKNVNLIGADILSYSKVEPNIANKKREMFGWMWGFNDGKLKINELPADSARIKEEYLKRGYIDANVSDPYLVAYRDNYTAELTYYIQEGERYRVSSVDIDAPEYLNLNKKKILKGFKLRKNSKMSSKWLRKDLGELENMVADKGYAFVEVIPEVTPAKEKNRVDILYKVVPRDRIYIRNLIINGNEKTADRVIRREMYLTEGNLYSRTDLVDSKNALQRTGYFEEVDIQEQVVSENQLDLIVRVKEAPTGSITGGIGYGSADGLLLNAGASERNIFGSGLTGDINIERSKKRLSGNIGLTNPRVFDSRYSLGGSIYANNYDWGDYEVDTYGGSVTLGRQFGRYVNTYLTYQYEKSKIKGVDEFYKAAGYKNGKNTKSSIKPMIIFNNTDDYYLPRHGIIANLGFEYAGIGGDIGYKQLEGGFKWFFGLQDYFDWDLIFRYRAQFGYIWASGGKKLPTNEKLFLGGLGSIRGYDARSIPRDQICLSGKGCKYVDIGGKKSFNNSVELSFPIISRIKMRGIAFFDYGMIGENKFSEHKRYSTGVGVEWTTPVGPLQFYWSKPLNSKSYDDTSRFDFAIGYKF